MSDAGAASPVIGIPTININSAIKHAITLDFIPLVFFMFSFPFS